MLRALLAGLALFFSTPAAAAVDWWWIGFSGSAPTRMFNYIDLQSVKPKKGDVLEVWMLVISETLLQNSQRAHLARYEVQCRAKKLAVKERTALNDKGEKIPLANIMPEKLTPAVAGSIGQTIVNFVCGRPSGWELQVSSPRDHMISYIAGSSGQSAASPAPAAAQEGERTSGFSTGTGFFIGAGGHVLTSYHVIQGADAIVCRTVAGQIHSARFVSGSVANDLALLQVNIRPTRYLSFAAPGSVQLGDRVFTMGFPMIDRLGTEPRFTEGTVSAMSALAENSLMQISIPIQPGNSGGPVLTEEGHVVGIIAATEAIESFYKAAGSLPQNVNWAVKSDYASPLLSPMQPDPARNREEAIALARDSVCLIGAERSPSGRN